MITSWWDGLTLRERVMLVVLATLLGITVLYFLIFLPMQSANANAKARFERSSMDSVVFERTLNRYQLSSIDSPVAGPAADADTFRSDIAPLARDFGLAVSRLQPTNDDHLLVTFDEAVPEDLFAFLMDVQSLPGGEVITANLNSRGANTVFAVVEFRGAGQP